MKQKFIVAIFGSYFSELFALKYIVASLCRSFTETAWPRYWSTNLDSKMRLLMMEPCMLVAVTAMIEYAKVKMTNSKWCDVGTVCILKE